MRGAALVLCVIMLLFTVLTLGACSDSSQPKADADVDGAMVPITNDSGTVLAYERRYHNDNGDVTRLDYYNAEQEYQSYVIYEYDDSNRLIKETTYGADGIGISYYTYDYYDDGTIKEKGYFTAKNGATRTLYDSEGKISEVYTYDFTDTLIKHQKMIDGKFTEVPIDDFSVEASQASEE